MNVIKTRQRMP